MTAGNAPLEGVRIVALSQFGAGPFGTAVLADLGAEVIKIEDPESGGDVARYVPPFEIEADSLYFQAFNRGKKSVAINLRHADGRAVFHDLVRLSDIVCNNLRGDQPAKKRPKGQYTDSLQCRLAGLHRTRHGHRTHLCGI